MASNLITLANSNIQINSDYIDTAVLTEFAAKPLERMSLEQALQSAPTASVNDIAGVNTEFNPDDDVDSVINKVLESLTQDDDLGDTVASNLETLRAQSKQNILDSFTSKPTEQLIENNQNSLVVSKNVDDGDTVFLVNGEQVAIIPAAERNSPLAISLEMILAWTFLIWHSVSFIATVIGIAMPKADKSNVKGVSKVVNSQSSTWAKFIARMKSVAEKVSASEKVKRFVRAFKVLNLVRNLGKIIKAILTGMGWLKIAALIVDFLASVALMFLTAGAELLRKMAKMTQQLAKIVQDLIYIAELERKTSQADAA